MMILTLLFTLVVSQAIPSLPEDFSTLIEANIKEKQYTFHLLEYHSQSLGKSRFEYRNKTHVVIESFDFNTKMRYEIIGDEDGDVLECATKPFSEKSRFDHQRNFTELFRFGGDYEETYQGEKEVRGMPAEHWTHTFDSARDGKFRDVDYKFQNDFFFSKDGWTVDGLKRQPVPVRSLVSGQFNNTQFDNHYEIVWFTVGNPPKFAQDWIFTTCDRFNTEKTTSEPTLASPAHIDDHDHDGPSGFVFVIIGVIIGAILGAGAMFLIKRSAVTTA